MFFLRIVWGNKQAMKKIRSSTEILSAKVRGNERIEIGCKIYCKDISRLKSFWLVGFFQAFPHDILPDTLIIPQT